MCLKIFKRDLASSVGDLVVLELLFAPVEVSDLMCLAAIGEDFLAKHSHLTAILDGFCVDATKVNLVWTLCDFLR